MEDFEELYFIPLTQSLEIYRSTACQTIPTLQLAFSENVSGHFKKKQEYIVYTKMYTILDHCGYYLVNGGMDGIVHKALAFHQYCSCWNPSSGHV